MLDRESLVASFSPLYVLKAKAKNEKEKTKKIK